MLFLQIIYLFSLCMYVFIMFYFEPIKYGILLRNLTDDKSAEGEAMCMCFHTSA